MEWVQQGRSGANGVQGGVRGSRQLPTGQEGGGGAQRQGGEGVEPWAGPWAWPAPWAWPGAGQPHDRVSLFFLLPSPPPGVPVPAVGHRPSPRGLQHRVIARPAPFWGMTTPGSPFGGGGGGPNAWVPLFWGGTHTPRNPLGGAGGNPGAWVPFLGEGGRGGWSTGSLLGRVGGRRCLGPFFGGGEGGDLGPLGGGGGWGCPGHPGPFLRGGEGGSCYPSTEAASQGLHRCRVLGRERPGGVPGESRGAVPPPPLPGMDFATSRTLLLPPTPPCPPLTPLNPPTPPPAPAHPSAAGSRSAPPPPEARKRGGDKGEGAWRWAGLLRERGVAFSGAWLLRGGSVAVAGKRRGFCGEREALALWGKGRGYEGSPAPAPPGLAAPYLTPVTDPGGGTGRSGEGFGRGGVSLGSLRGGWGVLGGPRYWGGGHQRVWGGLIWRVSLGSLEGGVSWGGVIGIPGGGVSWGGPGGVGGGPRRPG